MTHELRIRERETRIRRHRLLLAEQFPAHQRRDPDRALLQLTQLDHDPDTPHRRTLAQRRLLLRPVINRVHQLRNLFYQHLRNTLLFNGYGEQVASLYNGMNLKKYF